MSMINLKKERMITLSVHRPKSMRAWLPRRISKIMLEFHKGLFMHLLPQDLLKNKSMPNNYTQAGRFKAKALLISRLVDTLCRKPILMILL